MAATSETSSPSPCPADDVQVLALWFRVDWMELTVTIEVSNLLGWPALQKQFTHSEIQNKCEIMRNKCEMQHIYNINAKFIRFTKIPSRRREAAAGWDLPICIDFAFMLYIYVAFHIYCAFHI